MNWRLGYILMMRAHFKVLATTDIHAHVTNYDYYRDEILADIGLIGLSNIIHEIRSKHPNTLLIDNGDFLQGNPIGNYLRDYALKNMHPIVSIMNELQYDAGTLGNHEFDFGITFLEKMIHDLNYPIVNANIVDDQNNPWIQPYVILEREITTDDSEKTEIKIGIIGALPPQVMMWNHKVFEDYANVSKRLHVNDIVDSIKENLPKMRDEGADIIIVLAHSGFSNRPYEKGAENIIQFLADIDGIDAIVAGHAHNIFPDDCHFFNKPIIMAGSFAQYLGVFDFNLEWNGQKWLVKNVETSVVENQNNDQFENELFQLIKPAHELAMQRMNEPIVQNKTLFSSALSLVRDDACIQLIADAQAWYAKKMIEQLCCSQYMNTPLLTAVPAFKVGGRKNSPYDFTWIDDQIFTFKNIADLYPFNNQLAVIEINGDELKEWLECANSIYFQLSEQDVGQQYLINWQNHRGYNRDVIKGDLEYIVDARFPRRYNGDCLLINNDSERIYGLLYQGKAVQPSDKFLMATNQYRAYSGKFPGSGEEKVITLSSEEIPEIIQQYLYHLIADKGEIDIIANNNWRLELGEAKNIIYETSPLNQSIQYILKNLSNIRFTNQYDAQGFALFKLN